MFKTSCGFYAQAEFGLSCCFCILFYCKITKLDNTHCPSCILYKQNYIFETTEKLSKNIVKAYNRKKFGKWFLLKNEIQY